MISTMYLINEHYFIVFECEWQEWILAVDLLSLLVVDHSFRLVSSSWCGYAQPNENKEGRF